MSLMSTTCGASARISSRLVSAPDCTTGTCRIEAGYSQYAPRPTSISSQPSAQRISQSAAESATTRVTGS